MGKRANPQGLRLVQNKDWVSSFYSDPFNYSNIVSQDYLIYDFILNYFSQQRHIHVCKIRISRKDHRIFIHLDTLNDVAAQKRLFFFLSRRFYRTVRRRSNFLKRFLNDPKSGKSMISNYPHGIGVGPLRMRGSNHKYTLKKNRLAYNSLSPYFLSTEVNLNKRILIYRRRNSLFCFDSIRKTLAFRLSCLVKAPVFIKNQNIAISKGSLFRKFWKMSAEKDMKRAPLYRNVTAKVIFMIYHAIYFQSSLLLCRYLAKFLPSFCKKRRKERKIFPFFRFLSNVFRLLDTRKFLEDLNFKGIRLCFKGRYNGMRRKKKFIISRGNLSINTFQDYVSYQQAHSFTLFGVTGIKVWIISNKECSYIKKEIPSNTENSI